VTATDTSGASVSDGYSLTIINTWIDTAGNKHYQTIAVNSDGTIITSHETTDLGLDYTHVFNMVSGQVSITGIAVLSDGTTVNNVDIEAVVDFANEQVISLNGTGVTPEGDSVVISLNNIDDYVYTYTDIYNVTHAITSTYDAAVIEHIHIDSYTYTDNNGIEWTGTYTEYSDGKEIEYVTNANGEWSQYVVTPNADGSWDEHWTDSNGTDAYAHLIDTGESNVTVTGQWAMTPDLMLENIQWYFSFNAITDELLASDGTATLIGSPVVISMSDFGEEIITVTHADGSTDVYQILPNDGGVVLIESTDAVTEQMVDTWNPLTNEFATYGENSIPEGWLTELPIALDGFLSNLPMAGTWIEKDGVPYQSGVEHAIYPNGLMYSVNAEGYPQWSDVNEWFIDGNSLSMTIGDITTPNYLLEYTDSYIKGVAINYSSTDGYWFESIVTFEILDRPEYFIDSDNDSYADVVDAYPNDPSKYQEATVAEPATQLIQIRGAGSITKSQISIDEYGADYTSGNTSKLMKFELWIDATELSSFGIGAAEIRGYQFDMNWNDTEVGALNFSIIAGTNIGFNAANPANAEQRVMWLWLAQQQLLILI